MSSLIDLTGQTFGSRTVIRKVPKLGQQAHWFVRCACGSEDIVPSQRLRNGGGNSCRTCGRATYSKVIDLAGNQFGKWIVLGRSLATHRKGTAALWEVQCECGRQGKITTHELRSGHSKSCKSCGSTKYDYRMDLSDPDWCWLLGLFHGDGSTSISEGHGGTVTFSCVPPENQAEIVKALKRLGIEHGITSGHVNVYSVSLARDMARFKISSRQRAGWFFPETPQHWSSWLAGLLDADGCVSKTGRSITYYQYPHGGFNMLRDVLEDLSIPYSTSRRVRANTLEETVSILASGRARFFKLVQPRFPKRKNRIACLMEKTA